MTKEWFSTKTISEGNSKTKNEFDNLCKKKSRVQLEKIEQQLESTENRCKSLTEQLKLIKKKCGKEIHVENSNKIEQNQETILDGGYPLHSRKSATKTNLCKTFNKEVTDSVIERQHPQAITTDNSGSVMKTINNILSQFSVAVNPKNASICDSTTIAAKQSQKNIIKPKKLLPNENIPLPDTKSPDTRSQLNLIQKTPSSTFQMKVKLRSSKHKNLNPNRNQSSSTVNLKKKKLYPWMKKNKTQIANNLTSLKSAVTESTNLISRKRKRTGKKASRMSLAKSKSFYHGDDNLIEIYHNVAAKESLSDECQVKKSKPKMHKSKSFVEQHALAPVKIPTAQTTHALTPIDEQQLCNATCKTPRNTDFASKNYALPTFASQMRRVAKRYLSTFSVQTIPFCVATSITQSHNIGLNIQQVMSIIKRKQPLTGISPTLAHNINLAADRLQSRPFSTLVSTISSRVGYGRGPCPLTVDDLDYNHLQEMAREIQEEPMGMELTEDNQVSDVRNNGDTENSEWTINHMQDKRCTCVPQPGVSFQQMFHKFHTSSETNSLVPPKLKLNQTHMQMSKGQYTRRWIKSEQKETSEQLRGKEKSLKGVLEDLHHDFDKLNKQYEDLAKELDCGKQPKKADAVQNLLQIEREMNKKEEEIKTVMNLYNEVLALQEQIKKLQTPAVSKNSFDVKSLEMRTNHNTLMHLKQLLKQIQNYQLQYNNNRV